MAETKTKRTGKTFIGRIIGSVRSAFIPVKDPADQYAFELVPKSDKAEAGERYHFYFMASFKEGRIILLNSTATVYCGGTEMRLGKEVHVHSCSMDFYTDPLPAESSQCIIFRIISPDGHSADREMRFRTEKAKVRLEDIMLKDELSLDPGQMVDLPMELRPESCDDHLECEVYNREVCSAVCSGRTLSLKGLKEGTTDVAVFDGAGIGIRAICHITVREQCRLKIMAAYDKKGNPTVFSLRMSTHEDMHFFLVVSIRIKTRRGIQFVSVNDAEGESEFFSNRTMEIPKLAAEMRKIRSMHDRKSIELDFSLLSYDRRKYSVSIVRSYRTGEEWWSKLETEPEE